MGKIVDFQDVIQEEKEAKKLKFRGYILTIENRYMSKEEMEDMFEKIVEVQTYSDIYINPRIHTSYNNCMIAIDLDTEGQGTVVKILLANNPQYKLYRRMKTYKELAF